MPYVPGPSAGTAGVSLSGGSSSLFRSSFALSVALASLTPVLNLDGTGKPLTFRSALAGPFGPQWAVSDGAELVKLVSSTRTLCPVHSCTSSPTYFNRVVKEKWSPLSLLTPGPLRSLANDVLRRVRGTAGGDRLPSSCPPSTNTASLTAFNCILNAVVSENAVFGSLDLVDFYLGTPLLSPQFIKIFVDSYPPEVLSSLSLLPFIKVDSSGKRYCLFRIDKTMYGLKEAGQLSNRRLVSLLSSFGFIETSTPCLFRHLTRPISFVLVVDDFGVKYHSKVDFDFLVSALSSLYQVKAHPVASQFLGLALHHDTVARTIALSYPGYVDALLLRLRPLGVKAALTPAVYVPPTYGSRLPQSPNTTDASPPASPAQRLELQIAIGYLLYYGRCVDGRILPATCALASLQAHATSLTMLALDRLLGYLSVHRTGVKVIRPSSMILQIMSDASYLSRPNAGSVAGDFHHLGIPDDPTFINAPISIASTRIPVVCSSVQEAEWAGTFAAARTAITERQTLSDLGYPQPPTLLHCDNEVAVGIANKAVKAKLSKACDMRLHWLIDRVSQGQFRVEHLRGRWNIADFFTKTLPLARHRFFAPFVAVDAPDSPLPRLHIDLATTIVK
jgi:hypothetical protein